MKQGRPSPEQVIRMLAEGEKLLNRGDDVSEVCRQLEITESTWHRYQYGGVKANDAKRLKGDRKRERSTDAHRHQPGPLHRHAEAYRRGKIRLSCHLSG
jgi:putative transposase